MILKFFAPIYNRRPATDGGAAWGKFFIILKKAGSVALQLAPLLVYKCIF
jgi:hypothetical protein